ncbi:MAG: hypothetical protein L3J56_00520 [Bacteroidales bacterium]|nr:hypothetical protein [Bacteroidales bacterium]
MKINKETLQNYIDCLKKQSYNNSFIDINKYLINKSINFEENKCLLITLKARKEISSLLFSILSYAKNKYNFIPVVKEPIEIGNLVFYDNKVWKVIEVINNIANIKELIKGVEKSNIDTINLTVIENTQIKHKRRTIDFANNIDLYNPENYIAYDKWINNIRANFPQHKEPEIQNIEKNKILIISHDNGIIIKALKKYSDIPFKNIRNNGKEQSSNNCSNYLSIADIYQQYDFTSNAREINDNYNEIFIIGDKNIHKYFPELVKLQDKGRIKRFVLIGTDKPETNYPLIEWNWTKEEFNLLENKNITGEIRLKITGENIFNEISNDFSKLQELVTKILNLVSDIREKHNGIFLNNVYYFVNEYLRFMLPAGKENEISKTYLEEIHNKTIEYLESGDFKDAFYQKAVFNQDTIIRYSQQFLEIFKNINSFFYEKSPKYIHITSSLKNMEDFDDFSGGRHIITTRDTLEKNKKIQELHNKDRKIGSIRLFDKNKNNINFNQIIDTDLNASGAQFIFPFIFNRAQYELMLEANGDTKLYLYDKLEDYKYANVLKAHEQRFLNKIQHEGRNLFFECKYNISEEPIAVPELQPKETQTYNEKVIEEYNRLTDNEKDFFGHLYDVDDFNYSQREEYHPHDTSEYGVVFEEDNENYIIRGNRRVILIDSEKHLEIPLSYIQVGQEIIIYRNQSKELIYQILLNQDKSGLMQDIENASNLWFNTLKKIKEKIRHQTVSLYDLFSQQGINISKQRLINYLEHNSKFPKEEKILEAIIRIAIQQDLPDEYLKTEEQLYNILKWRSKYHSLTITLGRGISDEILHHYLTGNKGELLNKIDPDIVEVLKLNIKQGIVKSIVKKK